VAGMKKSNDKSQTLKKNTNPHVNGSSYIAIKAFVDFCYRMFLS